MHYLDRGAGKTPQADRQCQSRMIQRKNFIYKNFHPSEMLMALKMVPLSSRQGTLWQHRSLLHLSPPSWAGFTKM
jgi:hypothetical protein